MTLAADTIHFGDGYLLSSLQSVDSISRRVQSVVREVWRARRRAALSLFSSRSIVRPIAGVVSSLRQSEATGTLPDVESSPGTIHEIRELNREFQSHSNGSSGKPRGPAAGVSRIHWFFPWRVRRTGCDDTAGHCRRVSEYSCVIAEALNISGNGSEVIRQGHLMQPDSAESRIDLRRSGQRSKIHAQK